jgi:hypothetical protein
MHIASFIFECSRLEARSTGRDLVVHDIKPIHEGNITGALAIQASFKLTGLLYHQRP